MRRIYGAYLSAELDKAPLETLALLHLLILLPSDPLSEKIKAWLVEKMRLNPNIDNLNEVGAYILSQESDHISRKGTQDKANKSVLQVTQQEEPKDPPRKEFTCKICSKKHARFKCTYVCKHCSRKGHRAEACWTKFPVKPREPIPGLQKKKRGRRSKSQGSDRGSSFDASQNESESPNPRNRRRHRSSRVKVIENTPMVGDGFSDNDSSPSWGPSQKTDQPLRLFRVKVVENKEREEGVSYEGISDLSEGMEYSWQYEGISDLFEGME